MVKCRYEGMGVWFDRCMGTREVDPCVGYDKCKNYKPNCKTNGDRIRSMSDEELAEWIAGMTTVGACNDLGIPYSDVPCGGKCKTCIETWLKQPAEEVGDDPDHHQGR